MIQNLTEEQIHIIRLYRTENVGPNSFKKLIALYGNAKTSLEALPEHAKRGGMKRQILIPSLDEIEREIKTTQTFKAFFLFKDDFPEDLKIIHDAPPFLIAKGDSTLLSRKKLGMVGSRNASLNSLKLAQNFAKAAGEKGWCIVSGLARGIDTASHLSSIETGTIAVIAGGIDNIYPHENIRLYHQLYEKGLILTETPIGKDPQARFFPKRNRIISALSDYIFVVEATLKSGSLITANYAAEYGKEVLTVPGSPMDPRCSGTNQLIKEGATMILSEEDLIATLSQEKRSFSKQQQFFSDIQSERAIFINDSIEEDEIIEILKKNLSFNPIGVDELVRECQISSGELQSALLELELAGKISRSAGNLISLAEDIE